MNRFSRLLAVGSAALAFAGVTNAQNTFGAPQPGTGTIGPVVLTGANGPLYDHHWSSMSAAPTLAWGDQFLWSFFNNGLPNVGGPGDAIRVCYGVDSTQGGRNWTGPGSSTPGPFSAGIPVAGGGNTEATWFRVIQGFGVVAPGIDIGLISIQSGTTSARGGDNCFTPFVKGFSWPADSGGHKLAAAVIGGFIALPGPFPVFWELTATFGPTAVQVQTRIGDDTSDPGLPFSMGAVINFSGVPAPLLANVIYEVQAPLNSAANGTQRQYYLSSTVELAGINSLAQTPTLGYTGSGGVTNGNANAGFDLFGAPAGPTSAVSGSRVITTAPGGGFINENPGFVFPVNQPGPPFSQFRDGRLEFLGQIAFATPKLWSYHNFQANPLGTPASTTTVLPGQTPVAPPFGGVPALPLAEGLDGNNGFLLYTGSGGPDWSVSGAGLGNPLSRVDIIAIDHETGAETSGNVYARVGSYTTTSPTTAVFTPNGVYAHAAQAFDTTIGTGGFYFGIIPCKALSLVGFNWTLLVPAAAIHPQYPGSWGFDIGTFTFTEGNPGNFFGPVPTTREGVQVVPHGFIAGDPLFSLFLSFPSLTFSSFFSQSDDFFADGALDYGGNIFPSFSSIFQGTFAPETSGQADMAPGGGQQFVGFPDPGLPGLGLNLSGAGITLDICGPGGTASPIVTVTEVYNAMTIAPQ